jgi:hypothetical protein
VQTDFTWESYASAHKDSGLPCLTHQTLEHFACLLLIRFGVFGHLKAGYHTEMLRSDSVDCHMSSGYRYKKRYEKGIYKSIHIHAMHKEKKCPEAAVSERHYNA